MRRRVRGLPLESRFLFYALILLVRPDTICDVGSCDGSEAFRFRRLRPGARVVAFEANPNNYQAIANDPRSRGIELRHEAVADQDGELTFYVVDVPEDKPWARGASSLGRRAQDSRFGLTEMPVSVQAHRLDTVLADASPPIALWIDVEGAASRVVAGFDGIVSSLSFITVEVEHHSLWEDQTQAPEVIATLQDLGFRVISRQTDGPSQDNVVLVRDVSGAVVGAAKSMSLAAQVSRRLRNALVRK